jgi:hypothetical protein
VKIYRLFEKVGIDKVKYIRSYSAIEISKLTNYEIQKTIDHFTEKSNLDFTDDPDEQNEDNSSNSETNQNKALEGESKNEIH